MARKKLPVETPIASQPAAEWVAPAELNPWGKNPRRNDAAVKAVVESIKRYGFGAPIVARRADKRVIAGHTRLKAAKVLKLDLVPVRFLDITAKDADQLTVADNKLGELAEWDEPGLAALLEDTSMSDALALGFDAEELKALARSVDEESEQPRGAARLSAGLSYQVVVTVANETAQAELLERLEGEGFACKPLIL